jgi:hypothetical protein
MGDPDRLAGLGKQVDGGGAAELEIGCRQCLLQADMTLAVPVFA